MRVLHCGSQHHFIGSCNFHLATFIDDVLVSTVGEYMPNWEERREIGAGRYYETYVFRTDDNWDQKAVDGDAYAHPDVTVWSEMDALSAQTAEEATQNHALMVSRWSAKVEIREWTSVLRERTSK